MMAPLLDCREFDRLWNDRLDARTTGSPERALMLIEHAQACHACRGRESIYLKLESGAIPWVAVPPPSSEAIESWGTTDRPVEAVRPGRPDRRAIRLASKWTLAAAGVASALMLSRASLPLLFPIEPAPSVRDQTESASPLLEEAFAEASAMTRELAREIAAPASRIGSEPWTWSRDRSLLSTNPTEPGSAKTSDRAVALSRARSDAPVEADLISGSARDAFRFLIGTGLDESARSDQTGNGF